MQDNPKVEDDAQSSSREKENSLDRWELLSPSGEEIEEEIERGEERKMYLSHS